NAPVRIGVPAENAAAIDRGENLLAVGREDHLMGGGGHVDLAGLGERRSVEELHLIGGFCGGGQGGAARGGVWIRHRAHSTPGAKSSPALTARGERPCSWT